MTTARMAEINRRTLVIQLAREGWTYSAISKLTGMAHRHVSRVALAAGIRRGRPKLLQS